MAERDCDEAVRSEFEELIKWRRDVRRFRGDGHHDLERTRKGERGTGLLVFPSWCAASWSSRTRQV